MTDNRIYYPQQPLIPAAKPAASTPNTSAHQNSVSASTPSFGQILDRLSDVKFSQHALQRLQSRNIKLNQSDVEKLNTAVDKAAAKGSKESLILMNNNLALVVSVKNKMVITAIDGANIKDNVFTNIDSAVII